MATINYSNIVRRYPNIKDGFVELERLLGQPPTTSESITLASAYQNISNADKSTSGSFEFSSLMKIQDYTTSVTSSSFLQSPTKFDFGDILEKVGEYAKTGLDKQGGIKTMASNMMKDVFQTGIDSIGEILQQETILRNEINSQIGISGELSRGLRTEMIDSLSVISRMGFGFDDMKDTIIGIMEANGTFAMYNRDIIEKMAAPTRAFFGDMQKMETALIDFQKVGYGAGDAIDKIMEAGESSIGLGINARKVTTEIVSNISKLNEYGFKNGIEGLTRMVQKSIELGVNLKSTFDIAEELFSPEKALALSAELQAIGGVIGDFNDPMRLMYMATNDVGGLADSISNLAGSVTTYNEETGKFEISTYNLRKARDMAKLLNIDYKEFSETAIKSAERASGAMDLMSRGISMDDEQKEFLLNLSRMDGGRMVIDIPKDLAEKLGKPTRVALENLDQTTANALFENQETFKKMSTEEIAKNQYTASQNMGLTMLQILRLLQTEFAGSYRNLGSETDKYLDEITKSLMNNLLPGTPENTKYKSEIESQKGNIESGGVKPVNTTNVAPVKSTGVDNKMSYSKQSNETNNQKDNTEKNYKFTFESKGPSTDKLIPGFSEVLYSLNRNVFLSTLSDS